MAVTLAVLIGVALILLIGREALGFHARALRLSRDELAAEARRIEIAVAAGQRELQFLRLGSQQILKLPVDDDFAGDPGLQRGYGQRAQAAWSVPGRGTSPPIRGVGPDLLTGLPGFARNDADLPADLVLARRFSEIIGAIVAVDPMSVRAVYVSSNGLLAAVPDLPDKDTAALLRLVAGRPYFQAALAGKDVTDGLTWGAPLPEGDATRPSVGLALPLTTDGRVRGIIALFMLQQYLLDAAVQADSPEPPAPASC